MDFEVILPEEFWGTVIGDLTTRRAEIIASGNQGKLKTARCRVPLAEMFNYANAIRSLTQGRGSFTMEPAFYGEVPRHVGEKIKGERQEAAASKK
jgi:elongation factor G